MAEKRKRREDDEDERPTKRRRDKDRDDDETDDQRTSKGESRGFPLWILAAIIPVVFVLICGLGGIGYIVFRKPAQKTSDEAGLGTPNKDTQKGDQGSSPGSTPTPDTNLKLMMHVLYNEYTSGNLAAADLKYTDKTVEVCEVNSVAFPINSPLQTTAEGQYYLNFRMGLGFTQVVFRPSERAKLADFKNAEAIKVRGVCRGLAHDRRTLLVDDAELIPQVVKTYYFRLNGNDWQDSGMDIPAGSLLVLE